MKPTIHESLIVIKKASVIAGVYIGNETENILKYLSDNWEEFILICRQTNAFTIDELNMLYKLVCIYEDGKTPL